MKKIFVSIFAVILVAAFSAFKMIEMQTVRSLERIGISADMAKQSVWSSFSGGYLSYPNPIKLKQIAARDRAAVVREIFDFAKQYTQSDDFKKLYIDYREEKKPTPPEVPKSAEEQRQEQKAEMQKSLKESEENMKKAPADQKPIYKGVIDMLKQQLKQLDDPSNPMFGKEMDAMMKQAYDAQMEEHKTKLAEWESAYPTNPTPMIKKWLTDFLEASKDVDFSAELVQGQYGKKVFAKPEYEAKPSNWKMCYRAGKETVQAGRAAAQQWLKDLK